MSNMSDNYHISVDANPDSKDVQYITDSLSRDAETGAGMSKNFLKLGLFVRDSVGSISGGLIADIAWGWLYICNIWLAEGLRGRGYGKKLLETAEDEAKKRGCRNAYLETFSFQARPFYEKLGYEVYGTLEDMPPGHRRYLMRKRLG